MFKYYIKSIITLFIFICLLACSDENESLTYDDITGEWELVEAKRNGRVTTTFQKSIFTFSDDSVFTTNIPRLENLGKVAISGSSLLTDSNKLKNTTVYKIDSTNNLVLETNIRDYKFVFILEKR